MKITTVEINRFGRFEKCRMTLPDTPLVIIYGQNEAGKSTIMQFILNTLFGYPARNDIKKWLDGADESQIGGSLLFNGNDGANYRLERFFAQNSAPVLLKNGIEKGDPDVMLRGIDRMLYQDVFCFDLDGLNGIEKKKPSELNHLLLGAGMTGSRDLTSLEQYLDKKTRAIFKKSGKNPALNQLFGQLETSSASLSEWSRKMDSYRELRHRTASDKENIEALEEEKRKTQDQYREWSVFTAVSPLLIGYRAMNEEIAALNGTKDFPGNGRSRFEEMRKEINDSNKEAAGLEEQIHILDQSIAANPVREPWLKAEGDLTAWFRSAVRDEQDRKEAERLGHDRDSAQTQLNGLLRRLGPEWTEDTVRKASVGLPFVHQLETETGEWKSRVSEHKEAENELVMQQKLMEQLKMKMNPSRHEKADEPDRTGRRDALTHQKQNRRNPIFLPLLSMVMTLALAVLSAYFFTLPAALPVLLAGGALTMLLLREAAVFQNGNKRMSRTEPDHRREAEINLIREQLADTASACREKAAMLEQLTAEQEKQKKKVDALLRSSGYPGCAIEWADEAVRTAGNARAYQDKIDEMTQTLESLQGNHHRFLAERARLAGLLDLPDGDPDYIERRFRKEKENDRIRQELKGKRDVYLKQRAIKISKLNQLNKERTALLHQAGTDSPDIFLEKADQAERRAKLTDARDQRWIQMLEQSGGEEKLSRFSELLDEGSWTGLTDDTFKNRLGDLDRKIRTAREGLQKDQSELSKLEENNSYREALDNHQQLLTEANARAREWMIYRTAQWAIQTAKDRYRNQKLPRILHDAALCFERITSGTYVSLEVDPSEGFIAGRNDGRHFRAEQLSRGTTEQLYLSLRLALADQVGPEEKLPIIIDDGLVNFDHVRAGKVFEILKETAAGRQIILFTCHEAFLREMPPESVIRLDAAVV
jgi:Uncharacterized conserved protein